MKRLAIEEIEKAVSGVMLSGRRDDFALDVVIDSRKAKQGDIFFALIGEHHDAHRFIPDAIEKGARILVISERDAAPGREDVSVLLVEDTTKALQDLARWYAQRFLGKKIGITGSTGKTSTKDILYAVCAEKYKTAKTVGNLNNHIGLPLSILSMEEGTEVAVLEMGTERLGEIHLLADIVRPDIAIITNIGITHIETFGNRENILKGKMEITDYFNEDSLLIVNEESDLLGRENTTGPYRRVSLGSSGKSDFIVSDICDFGEDGVEFTLERKQERRRFKMEVPGRHNAINASLAVAAACELSITLAHAAAGLCKAVLTEKRLAIRGKDGMKIIDDTYNASPDSMKAGIDVLMATKGMRKVAILGDMLGLGPKSKDWHREVGEYAFRKGVDLLIGIGPMAEHIADGAETGMGRERVLRFQNKEQFTENWRDLIVPGDVILVKGSRATAMDQVVKKIME